MSRLVYCDDCGKLIRHKDKGTGRWKCECGLDKAHEGEIYAVEKIEKTKLGDGVYKEGKHPGFPHKCKKCGFGAADVDVISAFYSDESDISLFRCQKCGFVERVTDGTSN